MIRTLSAALLAASTSAWPITTIGELDRSAAFNFVVMSDNKGSSPLENAHMRKCDQWAKDSKTEFILGLGDHVKKGTANAFIGYMKNPANTLWNARFYPNVADGENEYWGAGQGDWGAGKPIFDAVNLAGRANVELRANKVEYYAKLAAAGFSVHLIQLHFADSPGPDQAFRPDSRQYMMDELASIPKGDKDIIVVMAHSQNGDFLSALTQSQRAALLAKADFLMSATTHTYRRITYAGFESSGTLSLNTGSVGNSGSENGFLQIHVLDNPVRLVVQYQSTEGSARQLRGEGKSYLLEKRSIKSVDWSRITPPVTRAHVPVLDLEGLKATVSRDGERTRFRIYAQEAGTVSLSIADSKGVLQGKIFEGRLSPGLSAFDWSSGACKPGVYYLQGLDGRRAFSKAFMLMK